MSNNTGQASQCVTISAIECVLKFDRPESPIILTQYTASVIRPNKKTGITHIREGRVVDFACPGTGNSITLNGTDTRMKTIAAICDPDGTEEGKYSWLNVVCKIPSNTNIVYRKEMCASNKGTLIELIFDLESNRPLKSPNRFVKLFTICFDERTMIPYYTHNKIRPIDQPLSMKEDQYIKKDRRFHAGFYRNSMQTLYKRRPQRACINQQLGINATSKAFIGDDSRHFLAPGLLASPKDFSHPAFREATYRYLNVAPQWNGNLNWKELENEIVKFAIEHRLKLDVWTGTYGNMKLPRNNSINETEDIFLYVKDNIKLMPVPELLWKILYDRLTKRAIVFVVTNNPYVESPTTICTDLTNSTEWLSFPFRDNPKYGYVYTCSYHEFKQKVVHCPNIQVKQLFLKYVRKGSKIT